MSQPDGTIHFDSNTGAYSWTGGPLLRLSDRDDWPMYPHRERDRWGRACFTIGPYHLWVLDFDVDWLQYICIRDSWWATFYMDRYAFYAAVLRCRWGLIRLLYRLGCIDPTLPQSGERFSWRQHFRLFGWLPSSHRVELETWRTPPLWSACGEWGNNAASGVSRFRWLATVKALWNVTAYRLLGRRRLWWD